jgi:hypothetical protein
MSSHGFLLAAKELIIISLRSWSNMTPWQAGPGLEWMKIAAALHASNAAPRDLTVMPAAAIMA